MTKHNVKPDVKRFIDLLDINDLVQLNNYIVKRIKLISSAIAIKEVHDFDLLDRVYFINNDGNRIIGTIVRLNQKTVTIKSDDGVRWRVSPYFLKRLQ
ncbi:MAG: hypothetical protein H8E13_12635 [Actinobacteria bacterium]|nr:hypothetical protein [Actinomycetota bacterium]